MVNFDPDSTSAEAYAALARYYDLQHATFRPDIILYEYFARQCRAAHPEGVPILEIGCGTARVMQPLVEAGNRVVGVDESPEMLQIARVRLAAARSQDWQLIQADARGLNLPDRFGMAIIALNTFLHNLMREDQLGMLAAVRRHLLPDGFLIVDLPSNDELSYQPDDGEFDFDATLIDPATDRVIDKYVASRVLWSEQVQVLSYRMDDHTPDGIQSRTVTFRLRHVFKHEMELLLLMSGFTHCEWYGDYDLSVYGENSPRMIALARW